MIDIRNPTLAEIQNTIARVAGQNRPSTAVYVFYDGAGQVIDQNHIMQVIKDMFAHNGPADENGIPLTLPWNGCLGANYVTATLLTLGVRQLPFTQPQTDGWTVEIKNHMKNRISSIKLSLVKAMEAQNRAAQGAIAGAAVNNPIQQVAAVVNAQAANVQAAAAGVQLAADRAAQAAYDRGLADGAAQEAQRAAAAAAGANVPPQGKFIVTITIL